MNSNASVGRWSPLTAYRPRQFRQQGHERSLSSSFSVQTPKEYSLAGAFGVEFPQDQRIRCDNWSRLYPTVGLWQRRNYHWQVLLHWVKKQRKMNAASAEQRVFSITYRRV
jgi:hypothetical protein